jgi:4-hydroxy-tetrahydrodipicolinate synthase
LDEPGLRRNIDFVVASGVAGIVPCGTTGESATLSWDEHLRVVDVAIEQAASRVQVIAGAGSNSTAESIAAARHAQERKADGVLCITPYYNKPTQEGLYQHYRAIASAVEVPIIVYNVPSRTGVNILPSTLERLCAFSTIAAVKEASGNLMQVSELHARCGQRLAVLSGDDGLTLPILACGGQGVVSVTANVVPRMVSDLVAAFAAGDYRRALALHEQLLPLNQALFIETNPIPVKTAMQLMGLPAGALRLPLVAMEPENKRKLTDVLRRSGLLSQA